LLRLLLLLLWPWNLAPARRRGVWNRVREEEVEEEAGREEGLPLTLSLSSSSSSSSMYRMGAVKGTSRSSEKDRSAGRCLFRPIKQHVGGESMTCLGELVASHLESRSRDGSGGGSGGSCGCCCDTTGGSVKK
jgi:hypothetical protein